MRRTLGYSIFEWYVAGMIFVLRISVGESQPPVLQASDMSDLDRKLCLGLTNTSSRSERPSPEVVQLHGPYSTNNFICPQSFTLTCDVVGENLLWYLVHPQVNDEPLFTFLTSDHTASNNYIGTENGQGTDRVKHITRSSENIYIDFWGILINITVDAGTGVHKCNSSLIVNPFIKETPGIVIGCRSHCPSNAHFDAGTTVQSLLETKFAMTPGSPENLNYIREDVVGSSANNSESKCVTYCSVIKFYWDPPNNHNETMIDHYELTVGTQHVTVVDTEWIFIPNMTNLLILTELYIVNVLAVDICGQKGMPSILHMHKEDPVQCIPCYRTESNNNILLVVNIVIMIPAFLFMALLLCILCIYSMKSNNTSRAEEESDPTEVAKKHAASKETRPSYGCKQQNDTNGQSDAETSSHHVETTV